MKKNTNESKRQHVEASLQELQDAGLLLYEVAPDGKIKIEFNHQARLDMYGSIGDIPLPVHAYEKLKKEQRIKHFQECVSILLGIYFTMYSRNGKQVHLLPDIAPELEPDPLLLSLILQGYDLHRPLLNFQHPRFYWFRTKEGFLRELEKAASKQDRNTFAHYVPPKGDSYWAMSL